MQMYYHERKYNFKNYMKSSYKSSIKVQTGYQIYKLDYLQEKNRTMKIQTDFKHSVNVALKTNK